MRHSGQWGGHGQVLQRTGSAEVPTKQLTLYGSLGHASKFQLTTQLSSDCNRINEKHLVEASQLPEPWETIIINECCRFKSQGLKPWPVGKIWPAACLATACELSWVWHVFKGLWKKRSRRLLSRDWTWPSKPQIVTLWSFTEKVRSPLSWATEFSDGLLCSYRLLEHAVLLEDDRKSVMGKCWI